MPASPILYFQEMKIMLKIVHPVYCGIDGHKKFVIATIAATNSNNTTTYQTRTFKTFTRDLLNINN